MSDKQRAMRIINPLLRIIICEKPWWSWPIYGMHTVSRCEWFITLSRLFGSEIRLMQPNRNVRWAYGVRFSTLPLFRLSYDKYGNKVAVWLAFFNWIKKEIKSQFLLALLYCPKSKSKKENKYLDIVVWYGMITFQSYELFIWTSFGVVIAVTIPYQITIPLSANNVNI